MTAAETRTARVGAAFAFCGAASAAGAGDWLGAGGMTALAIGLTAAAIHTVRHPTRREITR